MKVVIVIAILILLAGCNKSETITINEATITLEVVQNDFAIYKGLMFRESLGENRGMLFVYNKDDRRSIWMKNMKFPLDLIYINSQGVITDIIPNVPPCIEEPCEIYSSENPVKYVLEVNAGFAQKNRITEGQRVEYLDRYK